MDFVEWNEYYETWYGGDAGRDAPQPRGRSTRPSPDKPIVISEYGYCACTADRPEDDARRARILETHNAVFRDYPWVGGLIFFDYNDYRTHIGDKGSGVLKQRVHGVVDVFGARKPSFEVLRSESSPVESLEVRPDGGGAARGRRPDAEGPSLIHAQRLQAPLDRLRKRRHPARAGRSAPPRPRAGRRVRDAASGR